MFLKIQQPNKISIFEDAELVRNSVHTMIDVCGAQTRQRF